MNEEQDGTEEIDLPDEGPDTNPTDEGEPSAEDATPDDPCLGAAYRTAYEGYIRVLDFMLKNTYLFSPVATPSEVDAMLRVRKGTMLEMIRLGLLRAHTLGSHTYILRDELDDFLSGLDCVLTDED